MAKSESSEGRVIASKGALAVLLSQLEGFKQPKVRVEQYETDSEIAAEVLWNAFMKGDVRKVSADFGCGTGILGIGLLVMGAEKVHFVDSDEKVMDICKRNVAKIESEYKVDGKAVFRVGDIDSFNDSVDLVVMNPPFGIKVRHMDKVFLEKAFLVGKVIYSFHKTESKKFLDNFSKDNKFKITNVFEFRWPLKATMKFHRRKSKEIDVSCFRFEKQK